MKIEEYLFGSEYPRLKRRARRIAETLLNSPGKFIIYISPDTDSLISAYGLEKWLKNGGKDAEIRLVGEGLYGAHEPDLAEMPEDSNLIMADMGVDDYTAHNLPKHLNKFKTITIIDHHLKTPEYLESGIEDRAQTLIAEDRGSSAALVRLIVGDSLSDLHIIASLAGDAYSIERRGDEWRDILSIAPAKVRGLISYSQKLSEKKTYEIPAILSSTLRRCVRRDYFEGSKLALEILRNFPDMMELILPISKDDERMELFFKWRNVLNEEYEARESAMKYTNRLVYDKGRLIIGFTDYCPSLLASSISGEVRESLVVAVQHDNGFGHTKGSVRGPKTLKYIAALKRKIPNLFGGGHREAGGFHIINGAKISPSRILDYLLESYSEIEQKDLSLTAKEDLKNAKKRRRVVTT